MTTLRSLAALSALAVCTLSALDAQAFEYIRRCPTGGGVTWSEGNRPVRYWVNQNGSDNFTESRLTEIIEDAFVVWEEPCSSGFRASNQGTTSRTALEATFRERVILSFAEQRNQWPQQLGDPFGGTLAVTLSSTQGCDIQAAPIIFNGVGVTFTDQCNERFCEGGNTDLQGVAAHEIGHMLGLDHSPQRQATMFFAYQGGSGARSLAQDDIAGVSDLYPRACTCARDEECTGEREQCIDSRCERVPCSSDTECEEGLVCDRGSGNCIVPPCTSDNDCGVGFSCEADGTCRSTCPVCRDCTESNQCGGNAVCADLNGDAAGECLVFCGQGGTCPGDAACFRLPTNDGDYFLCLNPDAANGNACGDDYVCQDPPPDPCEGVNCPAGQICMQGMCVADPNNMNNTNNGNNTNNTTGNTNNGNNTSGGTNNGNTSGQDDDELLIIPQPEPGTTEDGCCFFSTSQSPRPPSPLWLLAAALGLVALRRRRRSAR